MKYHSHCMIFLILRWSTALGYPQAIAHPERIPALADSGRLDSGSNPPKTHAARIVTNALDQSRRSQRKLKSIIGHDGSKNLTSKTVVHDNGQESWVVQSSLGPQTETNCTNSGVHTAKKCPTDKLEVHINGTIPRTANASIFAEQVMKVVKESIQPNSRVHVAQGNTDSQVVPNATVATGRQSDSGRLLHSTSGQTNSLAPSGHTTPAANQTTANTGVTTPRQEHDSLAPGSRRTKDTVPQIHATLHTLNPGSTINLTTNGTHISSDPNLGKTTTLNANKTIKSTPSPTSEHSQAQIGLAVPPSRQEHHGLDSGRPNDTVPQISATPLTQGPDNIINSTTNGAATSEALNPDNTTSLSTNGTISPTNTTSENSQGRIGLAAPLSPQEGGSLASETSNDTVPQIPAIPVTQGPDNTINSTTNGATTSGALNPDNTTSLSTNGTISPTNTTSENSPGPMGLPAPPSPQEGDNLASGKPNDTVPQVPAIPVIQGPDNTINSTTNGAATSGALNPDNTTSLSTNGTISPTNTTSDNSPGPIGLPAPPSPQEGDNLASGKPNDTVPQIPATPLTQDLDNTISLTTNGTATSWTVDPDNTTSLSINATVIPTTSPVSDHLPAQIGLVAPPSNISGEQSTTGEQNIVGEKNLTSDQNITQTQGQQNSSLGLPTQPIVGIPQDLKEPETQGAQTPTQKGGNLTRSKDEQQADVYSKPFGVMILPKSQNLKGLPPGTVVIVPQSSKTENTQRNLSFPLSSGSQLPQQKSSTIAATGLDHSPFGDVVALPRPHLPPSEPQLAHNESTVSADNHSSSPPNSPSQTPETPQAPLTVANATSPSTPPTPIPASANKAANVKIILPDHTELNHSSASKMACKGFNLHLATFVFGLLILSEFI